MSTLTTNYKLTKPTLSESGDIRVINANMDIVDSALQDNSTFQVAGGTSNAIILTVPTTMQNGYTKTFIASANNSGATTTINGKQFYKPNTTTTPTLISGKAYTIWYNSAGGCFFIKASAEGTTIVSHVLAGDGFSNETDTGLIGTMPNNGGTIITPSTVNQAIPLGYQNGAGYCLGDADLISANIKANANIFGVQGKASVVDTIDANASANNIVSGYSAYVNGAKVNGSASIESLGGKVYASGTISVTTAVPTATVNMGFTPRVIVMAGGLLDNYSFNQAWNLNIGFSVSGSNLTLNRSSFSLKDYSCTWYAWA